MRNGVRIFSAILLACLLATAAAADDVTTEVHSSTTGVTAEITTAASAPATEFGPTSPPKSGGRREATILWHRHFEDPIYSSTGIAGPAEIAFAGTYLNPPQQVEASSLTGSGTPDWTMAGNIFYVDASRDGDVLASVDFSTADSTATIREWHPGSSTPLWSYVVHPCRTMVYQGWASRKPLRVSDDGSTIAAAIVMYTPAGQRGRLLAFDAGNGTPAVDYELPAGNVVATEISAHGEFIAMAGWPTLYVYDRYGQTLRWSGPIYSGNDALAISGDGRYVGWGWTTFRLLEWDGNNYVPRMTATPGGGLYVGQCALANDNRTLALAWDNGSTTPNELTLELYDLPSLDLLWTYDFGAGDATGNGPERDHVDIMSHMRFAPDGEALATASWGDTFPELHVFERADPTPLYTLDTPGSMFDLDIATAPGGNAYYVTTCGKGVHAGTGGRGGDLYAIHVPHSTTGIDGNAGGTVRVSNFDLAPNYPNPFNPRTTIAYTLADAGAMRLTVHDPQGRLVKILAAGSMPAGDHRVIWQGTNQAGNAVASGVYLLRLEAARQVGIRKILLAR